jgi:hypothetical protein
MDIPFTWRIAASAACEESMDTKPAWGQCSVPNPDAHQFTDCTHLNNPWVAYEKSKEWNKIYLKLSVHYSSRMTLRCPNAPHCIIILLSTQTLNLLKITPTAHYLMCRLIFTYSAVRTGCIFPVAKPNSAADLFWDIWTASLPLL